MRKVPQRDGKKECCRCKILKPRAEFPANRALADGLGAMCRLCKRASDKELRERKLGIVRPQDAEPPPIAPPKKKHVGTTKLKTKPTKCTPEVIADICVHLERGHTRNSAAAGAGVLPRTFANWLTQATDPDPTHHVFHAALEAVELAEAKASFLLTEKVRDGAEIDFNQAKWILERRDPDWQRRDQVELSGAEAVDINAVRSLILDKLDKLVPPAPPTPAADAGAAAPAGSLTP